MQVTAPVTSPAHEPPVSAPAQAPGFAGVLARRMGRPVEHVTLGEMLRDRQMTSPQVSAGIATSAVRLGPLPALGARTGPRTLVDPLASGVVTSRFGTRTHPVTGDGRMHHGLDLGAPSGTPVRAVRAGEVVVAEWRGGYGNFVTIDHGDGLTSRYAHHARLDVRAGEWVAAGQVIGTVGSTGQSTGPHLHFELRRDGTPVDPAPLLGR